jgi:polyphenol oxidase
MLNFFKKHKDIVAVFSEKLDGPMKLTGDAEIYERRKAFLKKAGVIGKKTVYAEQMHGEGVSIAGWDSPNLIQKTDSLITKEKDIYLCVTTADCIPVFFFDPVNHVVGLTHAGWKGIANGIIENTVREMMRIGGKIESIEVALGPGIGKCHFEIKKDILEKFNKYLEFVSKKGNGKIFLDLKGIIKKKLLNLNIKKESIEVSDVCTFCDKIFFSYRRDKPSKVEAMIAVIGMKK